MNRERELEAAREWLEMEIPLLEKGGETAWKIIDLTIRDINRKYGKDAANELIDEFELGQYGFTHVTDTTMEIKVSGSNSYQDIENGEKVLWR